MNEMNDSLTEILDRCLSRNQTGTATIQECLQEHPEHAEALATLLGIAGEVHSDLAPPEPGEVFVSTAKIRLLNRLRAAQKGTPQAEARRTRRLRWSWRPAYILASLMLALGLLAMSAGVARASEWALPGDVLYGVKRTIEEARLALTWSAAGDAALLTQFIDGRLTETEALLAAGREDDIAESLAGYEDMLTRLIDLADQTPISGGPGSLEHIQASLAQHIQTLQRVQVQAPPAAQEAISNAIDQSNHGQEVIESVRSGGSPSDLAPGQLKKTPGQPEGPPEDRGWGKEKDKTPGPKPKDKTPGPPP
jgi:hypothetical protein